MDEAIRAGADALGPAIEALGVPGALVLLVFELRRLNQSVTAIRAMMGAAAGPRVTARGIEAGEGDSADGGNRAVGPAGV